MRRRPIPDLRELPEELREPFVSAKPWASGLSPGSDFTAARVEDALTLHKRLRLLARAYGTIDDSDEIMWEELATALAAQFIPGLRLTRPWKVGRPNKDVQRFQIYLAVLEVLHTTKIVSVANASRRLADKHPVWGNAKSIEVRFHEAKRRIVGTTPHDKLTLDAKTGYPLNYPHTENLSVYRDFERFRVRYGNLPPGIE